MINKDEGAAVSGTEPGKRGIRSYLEVGDINASIICITALRGEVYEKTDIPGARLVRAVPRPTRQPVPDVAARSRRTGTEVIFGGGAAITGAWQRLHVGWGRGMTSA